MVLESGGPGPKTRSDGKTRIVAAGALLVFLSAVASAAYTGWRAATDSFIAPAILSPDSPLVLENKVKLAELDVEREQTVAESEEVDADLSASADALGRLEALRSVAETSRQWTRRVTAHQTSAGALDLQALDEQNAALTKMADKERQLTKDAKANMQAGVLSLADYEKQLQSLRQLKLALLENDRTRLQSRAQMSQSLLAERSLANKGDAPMMPERLLQQDQLVRIELEVLKLESETRAKRAEKTLVEEKLAKIDELETDLRSRPEFRAIDKAIFVGFVPYTQREGVKAKARVYDCVWGLFWCSKVGTVTEVVPGEVILPDPWGNQARGQYAVLELTDPESAKSKTLRVRPPTGG